MGFWQNCSLVFLLQFLLLHCPIVILVYHLCSFVIKQITVLVFQPSIWSNSGFLNFWLRRGSCGISEIFINFWVVVSSKKNRSVLPFFDLLCNFHFSSQFDSHGFFIKSKEFWYLWNICQFFERLHFPRISRFFRILVNFREVEFSWQTQADTIDLIFHPINTISFRSRRKSSTMFFSFLYSRTINYSCDFFNGMKS